MIVWSTFLLDELAGLRNDALPSCPECAGDPRFLAAQHRHRHRPAGPRRRRSPPSSARSARGPSRWTPTSTRPSGSSSSCSATATSTGWPSPRRASSRSGADRRPAAPSTSTPGRRCRSAWTPRRRWPRCTAPRCSAALQAGPEAFTRWGITQGQGDLIGASLGELPVAAAVAAVTGGGAQPQAAADEAAAKLTRDPGHPAVSTEAGARRAARPRRSRPPAAGPAADVASLRRADARAGLALISPTLVIVLVMVVLPILWTVLLAFQRLRLLNLRTSGPVRQLHAEQLRQRVRLGRVLGLAGHHAGLLGAGHRGGDRPRAGGRAGPARPVPRAQPGPGGDAAALRGPDRGRDLRLEDHAEPAVRRGRTTGAPGCWAGTRRSPSSVRGALSVSAASRSRCSR